MAQMGMTYSPQGLESYKRYLASAILLQSLLDCKNDDYTANRLAFIRERLYNEQDQPDSVPQEDVASAIIQAEAVLTAQQLKGNYYQGHTPGGITAEDVLALADDLVGQITEERAHAVRGGAVQQMRHRLRTLQTALLEAGVEPSSSPQMISALQEQCSRADQEFGNDLQQCVKAYEDVTKLLTQYSQEVTHAAQGSQDLARSCLDAVRKTKTGELVLAEIESKQLVLKQELYTQEMCRALATCCVELNQHGRQLEKELEMDRARLQHYKDQGDEMLSVAKQIQEIKEDMGRLQERIAKESQGYGQ